MTGPHDVGGRVDFGPVTGAGGDEDLFHADWERRALAVTIAAATPGGWTIDASRHARERLSPQVYYGSSYYEIWIAGLETLLVEHGLLSPQELASGRAAGPGDPGRAVMHPPDVRRLVTQGTPYDHAPGAPARFAVGDRVRTQGEATEGHTRLPGYARNRQGIIERVHGVHTFPDANAHGRGPAPQWLYSVRFDARELWGAAADPSGCVCLDAWESYLEPS